MLRELEQIMRRVQPMFLNRDKIRVMEKNGHANYVTNVDLEIQEYLKKALLGMIPEAAFVGEEQKNEKLGEGLSWVVDPIDGTTNFLREWKFSAVSVALLENKIPILAGIYQPFTNELFTAEKNKGAFLNREKINVSQIPFERAVVGFGTSPYQPELAEKSLKLACDFLKHTADLRRTGSAALDLAYIACGRQDIFFELNLSPWDVAAGALLVEEAGGIFQMPLSEQIQFERSAAVLATNASCAKEALHLFLLNQKQ